MRMGKWLHQAMYTHYLSFFKTEGLLAMGGWPHAQLKDFLHFWHERGEINVPEHMLYQVCAEWCYTLDVFKPIMQDGFLLWQTFV